MAIAALLGCVSMAGPAAAADGVIEINQARALAGGVTASDTPGFPVTIDVQGSYALTSDLDLTVAPVPPDTTGILVTADDVTIDMNGFVIRGPASCSGTPVTGCTGGGSGNAIDSWTNAANNLTVRNGTIRGAGSLGVSAKFRIHLEDLRVSHCPGGGIWIQEQGTLVRVHADHNGYDGVFAGDDGNVQQSTAYGNLNDGFLADPGSVLIGNTASRNGAAGIRTSHSATVLQNVAASNVEDGIVTGEGSTVSDNTANYNGHDGIEAGDGNTVKGNTANRNSLLGLNLGAGTGYVDNTMRTNLGAPLGGSGVPLGPNLCDGVLCP